MNVADLDEDTAEVLIPACCREGWDSCKHVVGETPKPPRSNIAV